MNKYIKTSFIYVVLALLSGVFYREFTKFNLFDGRTVLSSTHTHFFVLGTFLFMIIAIMIKVQLLDENKHFHIFYRLYNIALPLSVIMLYIRGSIQVLGIELNKGINASVSGISGVAHILIAVAFLYLFFAFKHTKSTD